MATTNIELYEALKKDLNEDAARMIAEVVPQAGDLATKGDLATEIASVRLEIANLKSYIDSRLLRYTAMILVPVAVTMLGTVGALIALVMKL
jgi:hypothetical protein